jgi:RNA polymerase sigma-70 factor, ECF subfamily
MLMTLSIGESLPFDDVPAPRDGAVASLVVEARSGSRGAFEQLHARFAPMVHGVVLARVPADAADDVVQDVFIHAMSRLDQLREPAAFGAWLAAIARRFTVRYHRRRRSAVPLEDRSAGAPREAPEERRQEAGRILEHLRRLPEAYAEVLVLRLVEGLTGPQIANALGLTPAAVRVNLHRGMALLRERLGEDTRETMS